MVAASVGSVDFFLHPPMAGCKPLDGKKCKTTALPSSGFVPGVLTTPGLAVLPCRPGHAAPSHGSAVAAEGCFHSGSSLRSIPALGCIVRGTTFLDVTDTQRSNFASPPGLPQ